MSASATKRPKMAPNATNLKFDQEAQAAQARLKFDMVLKRGRRGALKVITAMPIDILYEVGCFTRMSITPNGHVAPPYTV